MTFRYQWALLVLLAIPIIVLAWTWASIQRKRAARRFGDERTVASILRGSSGKLRVTRAVIALVGLSFCVVALAGPQYGSRTRLLRKRGVDIVVALDFSKSMLARDVRPNRIERAKAEITRLISELDGDRVGVVAFAGDTIEFPLTLDYDAVALFFRDLGPYDMPVGGTAIGRALIASQRLLTRSTDGGPGTRRSRVVILLTDGEDHEGDPLEAAQELSRSGIQVFVVGIGSKAGEPIPTYAQDGTWTGYLRDDAGKPVTTALTNAAERTLREVARATHGRYYHAGRGGVGVEQIRQAIRTLKQTELKARRVTVREDRYALFLFPAFILLLLEALLPDAWFGRKRAGATGALLLMVGSVLATPNEARAWELFRSANGDVERGNEQMKRRDAKGALEHYDRAARALPDRGDVQLNRGLALLALGQGSKSREALLRAAQPPGSPKTRSNAYYDLGLSWFEEGDQVAKKGQHDEATRLFREAKDAFLKSLRLEPGNRNAAWNLELAARRIRDEERRQKEKQQKEQNKKDKPSNPENDQKPNDQKPNDQKPNDQKPNDQKPNDQKPNDQKNPPPSAPEDPHAPDPQRKGQPEKPKGPAADKRNEAPKEPESVGRVLDSLRDSEENLERYRARARAAREPRRVVKDW